MGLRRMFSARLCTSASPSLRRMQGSSAVLFMRSSFTSNSSARNRRPPAGIEYMQVSALLSPSIGRTVSEARSVRRAISSARCSIEAPAFTCRTLDWLSRSFSKGMSREALWVIFYDAWVFRAIGFLRDGPARGHSPDHRTSYEGNGPLLFWRVGQLRAGGPARHDTLMLSGERRFRHVGRRFRQWGIGSSRPC
jgi:hypothetical protein